MIRPNQFIVAKKSESEPPDAKDGVYGATQYIVEGMENPSDAREKQRGWDSQKENERYEIVKRNGSAPSKVKERANEMVKKRTNP